MVYFPCEEVKGQFQEESVLSFLSVSLLPLRLSCMGHAGSVLTLTGLTKGLSIKNQLVI